MSMTGNKISIKLTHQGVLVTLLFGLIITFGLIEPVFFRPSVLLDVMAIMGDVGVMALGMTYIITTSGVDLSVGYNQQLSAVVFGMVYLSTRNLALAIAAALLCGTVLGFFNGLIVAKTKIPPLVTTLATMYLFRGISMILAGSMTYSGFPQGFRLFFTYRLFGVLPIQFIYFTAVFLILDSLYSYGALGRNLKGMGFNEESVHFSGVKIQKIKIGIYTLLGLLCGFAALMYLGRLSVAKTSIGDWINFQVITAVLLGGTSINGGVGSIRGTFIAILIIGVLKKGYTLMSLSGNIFNFTLGTILILSLIVFAVTEERKNVVSSKIRKTNIPTRV